MHRTSLFAVLPLLAACASARPVPPPAPQARAVEVPVLPPPSQQPKAERITVVTIDHENWSLEIPSNWEVDVNEEGEFKAHQGNELAFQVVTIDDLDAGTTPVMFANMATLLIPTMVPDELKVLNIDTDIVTHHGLPTNVTSVQLTHNAFMGVMAVEDEKNHRGYVAPCFCRMSKELVGLCSTVAQTFTLK